MYQNSNRESRERFGEKKISKSTAVLFDERPAEPTRYVSINATFSRVFACGYKTLLLFMVLMGDESV